MNKCALMKYIAQLRGSEGPEFNAKIQCTYILHLRDVSLSFLKDPQ